MRMSCLVLLMLALVIPVVVAQATWISGYVKDAEERPVAGATIMAKGAFETSTVTDANGYYKLGLSAGEWTVTVSYDKEEEVKTIILADGEHKVLDFAIGTYLTVQSTTSTTTSSGVTFTGAMITYGGTTVTEVVTTSPPSDLFYWWIIVIGVVVIVGIVLVFAARKKVEPSLKAKSPKKEAIATEFPPVVEKESRVTCSICGHVNPPYAVHYCVNCGARLK